MQHNSWKKDRELLAEAYSGAIDGGESADENIPPQYQDENQGIDNGERVKGGENPEIFQLIASVGDLDAVDMSEFLYGLAQIFDDPDVEDPAFVETEQHIMAAYKAFEGRMGN